MANVTYSPEAESDLLGIASYIARDKPAAARRWLQTVREKCELLGSHPGMGEVKPGFGVPGCRCFSIGNYVVFFRSLERDSIEISRVIHGSRDLDNL